MKLTKQKLKQIIKEELAEDEVVDMYELEDRFRTMMQSYIKKLDDAIAKPLIGKLISTYEDRGRVIDAKINFESYSPLIEVSVVFEKYPSMGPEPIAAAGLRPDEIPF